MDIKSIDWIANELIKIPFSEWTLTDATINSSNQVVIKPNGYMYVDVTRSDTVDANGEIQTGVISSGEYIKLGIDILEDVTKLNNYKNTLDVFISETYLTEDTEYNRTITRNMTCTSFNASLQSLPNHFVFLMEMLNKPLIKMRIKVQNNTNSDKTVTWIGAYASQDLGTYQYSQILRQSVNYYGNYIEARVVDPVNPEVGRIWLRTDLE